MWYKLYNSLGLTDAELNEYFAGAAFLAVRGTRKRKGNDDDDDDDDDDDNDDEG